MVVGQQHSSIGIRLFGRGDLVRDVVLAFFQTAGDRAPRKLAEDDHQQQKHDRREDREVALDLRWIFVDPGMAEMRVTVVVMTMIIVRMIVDRDDGRLLLAGRRIGGIRRRRGKQNREQSEQQGFHDTSR